MSALDTAAAAANGGAQETPDDDPTTLAGDPAAPQPSSRLEELRAAFQRKLVDPRLFKRLPAAGGKLVAEYRVLSAEETRDALTADADVAQNQDVLIRALIGLHARDPEHAAANDRGLVPLNTWLEIDAGGPLRFDKRLLAALDLEQDDTTARGIVLRLFDGNEIALGAHAAQVMAWMTDTSSEALQDFAIGS